MQKDKCIDKNMKQTVLQERCDLFKLGNFYSIFLILKCIYKYISSVFEILQERPGPIIVSNPTYCKSSVRQYIYLVIGYKAVAVRKQKMLC